MAGLVYSVFHILNDILNLVNEGLDANVVGLDGGNGGIDIVEIPYVIYQFWIVLNVSEVGFGGTGSVTIGSAGLAALKGIRAQLIIF